MCFQRHAGIIFLAALTILVSCNIQQQGSTDRATHPIVTLVDGGGATAHAEIDANHLIAVERAGNALIALTRNGHLLLFDLETVTLRRQRVCDPAYRCLSHDGNGRILAARADGRLDVISSRSLEAQNIAKMPGIPLWIGLDTRSGGIIGVLGERIYRYSGAVVMEASWVWDVKRDRRYTIPLDLGRGAATAFFIDRDGRFWLGSDKGEFGDWIARMDLRTGQFTKVDTTALRWAANPFGFFQQRDGTVLAYGGLIHFSASSYIAKVENDRLVPIYDFRIRSERIDPEFANSPHLPITQVLQTPASRDLIVLAYSRIFTLDPELRKWEPVAEVNADYTPGRPDAMGSYPAISGVVSIPGRPPRLIFATELNGLIELRGGKVVSHQLGTAGSSATSR
jgi:hypothetical protein